MALGKSIVERKRILNQVDESIYVQVSYKHQPRVFDRELLGFRVGFADVEAIAWFRQRVM